MGSIKKQSHDLNICEYVRRRISDQPTLLVHSTLHAPKNIQNLEVSSWRVSRYYRTVEIRNMSSTADRQDGSPPDSSGSSSGVGSSTPSGGSSSNTEVIDVDFATRSVLVIKAQPIFNLRGQEHELPPEVINTVVEFVAAKGYQRSGSRESLFMYSLGVYLKPIDVDNPVHKYYCLASPECRDKKHAILCKEGDRSNVNSQHKKKHNLCGMSG